MDGPDQTPAARRRRLRKWILGGVLILAAAVTVTFRNPLFFRNVGVVVHDRVFRAAQPEANLRQLVDSYRVASILNLRGGSIADPFYDAEVRLTRERGIDFYDLPLSATRRPARGELLQLIDLFERCRYPLLIHCKSGSDRTGLACGLYLLATEGKSPGEALSAFSLYYGHVPIGGTARLHEPFLEYDRWLGQHGLKHEPSRFRAWVEHEYRSDDPATPAVPLQAGPRETSESSVRR